MKFVTYRYQEQTKIGAVVDGGIVDLTAVASTLLDLIDQGPDGLAAARALAAQVPAEAFLEAVNLLAPIPTPRRNIMCLGLNYAEHAAESYAARGREVQLPEAPVVFTKATTAVNGPYSDIPYDPAVSAQIDWEAEMGIVIGRAGKNIPPDQALDYIFGYTVINDISARDLQRRGKQFFKGKSLDGACPMGPWIITADEIADPHQLAITCRVNGVVKQSSNTRRMIFDLPATIAYLSSGMTLLPGDIIATGTPSGVGFARTPPEFLRPGDVVECEVEGIGLIRNRVSG